MCDWIISQFPMWFQTSLAVTVAVVKFGIVSFCILSILDPYLEPEDEERPVNEARSHSEVQ